MKTAAKTAKLPSREQLTRQLEEADRRIARAVACLQSAAWSQARGVVYFRRKGGGLFSHAAERYQCETWGYLAALFWLDATPNHTQLDIDSLIGARAWADGDAEVR